MSAPRSRARRNSASILRRRAAAVAGGSALLLAGSLTLTAPARAAGEHQDVSGVVRAITAPADTQDAATRRAHALVAQMTLDEKISQMHTVDTGSTVARLVPGIARLGIPEFRITNGPVGVGTGIAPQQPKATLMPAPVALAATFDPALARRYGTVLGEETRDVGHSLMEGPDLNIDRVPLNGRAFENLTEDPYLNGELATADVRGIQSQGVISEVKHYVANNQETNRKGIDERIDDRTLHEIYLTGFQQAVEQGRPGAVMCAYPSVNGAFMCQNQYLLTDVLRRQWGFDGFVQSDASATHDPALSAQAGQNLELRDNGPYDQPLKRAVLDGQVSTARLDQLITERLATEIRAGLFDRPLTTTPIDASADGAVSRSIAERGTVLLKNTGGLLPLATSSTRSVALIGPYAAQAHPGGGGSGHVDPLYTITPQAGLAHRAGAGTTITVDDGTDVAAAVAAAKRSDVVVLKVGDAEAEGGDRSSLSLPNGQDELIEAVAAANPHTIVDLNTGAPVLMPWLGKVAAVLESWYPGQEDGNALAAVLYGDVDPSGKLPVTFPASEQQVPANTPAQYPGVDGVATYSEKLQVGYRWYDAQHQQPLFPFGFGLSYTSFGFSRLQVTPVTTARHDVRVSVTVTNTGRRTGSDTAQVYVAFPRSAGEPPRQLQGTAVVSNLRPGEHRRVSVTLAPRAFSTWDSARQRFTVTPGRFDVAVGDSSRSLPVHAGVFVLR